MGLMKKTEFPNKNYYSWKMAKNYLAAHKTHKIRAKLKKKEEDCLLNKFKQKTKMKFKKLTQY